MTGTSKHIRTGFYNDFKGYDTVLISADINGLLEIENVFLELSQGLSSFDFSTLKLLDRKYSVKIKAYNDTDNIGLKQIDKGKFEWRLTKDLWHQFREMTTALYRNSNCGHQYLDSDTNHFNSETKYIDTNSLQVILSLDEYSLDFWSNNFDTCNSLSTK